MAANRELSRFVRDALGAGHAREEIARVLGAAGWSRSEVDGALDAWSETSFTPPIPRPQATVTARDFFVYALTFGVLIVGASYLVVLFHALIDLAYDRKEFAYWMRDTIRWAMAVLIVTVPVYVWLTLRERARLALDPSLYRSAIRKWMTYIALLVAASVLLGDLVGTIYALLNGDITVQFLLKSGSVAVVAGGVFLYYLGDIRRGDRS